MLALAVFAIADTMGPLASTRSSIANQGSCPLKRHAIRRPAFPTRVYVVATAAVFGTMMERLVHVTTVSSSMKTPASMPLAS